MNPLILQALMGSSGVGPSLIIGKNVADYLDLYSHVGSAFTPIPAAFYPTPTSTVNVAKFSPSGDSLALGISVSPYVLFYSSGAKLPPPATLPTSAVNDITWSSDGAYCVVVHQSAPYLTIYKRGVKLANPVSLPTSGAVGCAFSDDGIYLAVLLLSSPYLKIYKRSGDTFTALANPGTLPADQPTYCAWSPNGEYLALTHQDAPFLRVYKRTADTFSASGITIPTIPASTFALGVSWSADGQYLAVGTDTTPYLRVLKRATDTFTALANPVALPGASVRFISFSKTNEIAIVSSDDVSVYGLETDVLTKITDLTIGGAQSVSFYPSAVTGSP